MQTYPPILSEITELCDDIQVPITLADPNLHDLPLVYVNKAFEDLTQWKASEILGKNCRFLQGPKTDRTIVDELAQSFHNREGSVCSLVNYRRDGSEFLNLIEVQPVHVSETRQVLLGCQYAYKLGSKNESFAANAEAIDFVMRRLHLQKPFKSPDVDSLGVVALDQTLIRFKTVFILVQNRIIAQASQNMRARIEASK